MHDNEDVRVLGHLVKNGGEFGQLHLQGVKLFANAGARMLEGFDKLRGTLVARCFELSPRTRIRVGGRWGARSYHQEGRALKEDHFRRTTCLREYCEVLSEDRGIRDECVHDAGPRLDMHMNKRSFQIGRRHTRYKLSS